MKDVLISGKRIKTEIIIWMCCLCAAFMMNIFAIIKYGTNWLEVFTQLHIVLLLSSVIYLLVLVIRLAVWLLRKTAKKIKK